MVRKAGTLCVQLDNMYIYNGPKGRHAVCTIRQHVYIQWSERQARLCVQLDNMYIYTGPKGRHALCTIGQHVYIHWSERQVRFVFYWTTCIYSVQA
mgnify:CR=1 FL=1